MGLRGAITVFVKYKNVLYRKSFVNLLQQCHTSYNSLNVNELRCGIEVALVATIPQRGSTFTAYW